jgi:hypothetical protein
MRLLVPPVALTRLWVVTPVPARLFRIIKLAEDEADGEDVNVVVPASPSSLGVFSREIRKGGT